MTEAEWIEATTPIPMIEFLTRCGTERKLRLFACNCYRRIQLHYPDEPLPREVVASERVADGFGDSEELIALHMQLGARGGISAAWAANNVLHAVLEASAIDAANKAAEFTAWFALLLADQEEVVERKSPESAGPSARDSENRTLAALLRCIFGNPFRPVTFEPDWRTSTVVALAEGIYADRAFERLPILADALQDAGCGNEEVLAHCRSAGPHARGCRVVDLILGRS